MSEEKSESSEYAPLWEAVKNELSKREMSANKIAIIETEKIFKKAVEDKDLPGKDIEEQVKNYAGLFSNYDKLKYSRAMYKKIITKLGFDISAEDTKEIITGYYEAILDLEKIDFSQSPFRERMELFIKRNFYSFPRQAKAAIAAVAALSILTFVLTETETGRAFSSYLIGINNYFFYKVIPAIIVAALFIAAAIAIFYAYQNRNK